MSDGSVRMPLTLPLEVATMLRDLAAKRFCPARQVVIDLVVAEHTKVNAPPPQRGRPPSSQVSATLSSEARDPDATRAWVASRVEVARIQREKNGLGTVGRPSRCVTDEFAIVSAYASPVGQRDHDILPEHEHLRGEVERHVARIAEYQEMMDRMPPPRPGTFPSPLTHPDFKHEREAWDRDRIDHLEIPLSARTN